MEAASLQGLMEDRLIELSGIPEKEISEHKLEFLLEDEYIVPEGIFLYQQEIDEYTPVSYTHLTLPTTPYV